MLSHVWHACIMEAQVEQTLSSLNFPKVNPIGISQQFESQRNNPRKVLYVQGGRIRNLRFFTYWHQCGIMTWASLTPSCLKYRSEILPSIIFGILLPYFHRAPRLAVHSAAARRCHVYLDPTLAGMLFTDEHMHSWCIHLDHPTRPRGLPFGT